VVTCAAAEPARLATAREHAEVLVAGEDRVEPRLALQALVGLGHKIVLCEGGPTLLGEVVADGLLDELCLTLAPLMGGDHLPIALSPRPGPVTGLRLAHVARDGDVLFLRYQRSDGNDSDG
jgi:riboflavin biosynthesis pyrimidine reductase